MIVKGLVHRHKVLKDYGDFLFCMWIFKNRKKIVQGNRACTQPVTHGMERAKDFTSALPSICQPFPSSPSFSPVNQLSLFSSF